MLSPELMALNRSITSLPSCVRVESVVEVEPEASGEAPDGDVPCDSSVLSADCALVMSLDDSAVSTLDKNLPSGLDESAFEGVSCSTLAR